MSRFLFGPQMPVKFKSLPLLFPGKIAAPNRTELLRRKNTVNPARNSTVSLHRRELLSIPAATPPVYLPFPTSIA
jgi:hypothetical protein